MSKPTFDFVAKNGNNVERVCGKISSFRLKPCPFQQQCPSNIVECYKLNDSSTMSNVASTSTLLPFVVTMLPVSETICHFRQRYCRFRQQCCLNRQQCRCNIRFCRKNRSTCSFRRCCFDIVASVDGTYYGVLRFHRRRRPPSSV